MASLLAITRFLNKELDIKNIPDASKNGMQVRGKNEVKKIGFAVDACIEVFEKAKKQQCDLVIVHHGALWKNFMFPNKWRDRRVKYLKKNKMSLYGCHLPLDKHKKYGNNIEIAKILELKNIKEFGKYSGKTIGYKGIFKKSITIKELEKILNKKLKTKSKVLPFGQKKIKSIGIVSGGGASALPEAIEERLDCFLSGEINHVLYHYIKENKINVIAAGHYATETLGVKALMPILKEKFGVQTVFIDLATGL